MDFIEGLSKLGGSIGDFLGGAWDGMSGNVNGITSNSQLYGLNAGKTVGNGLSGLSNYLTPENVGMASKVFNAYNSYDMNKSYKKNMEQDMANQNALTQSALAANRWNLQQAKDAEEDKDQFQQNAISGFNRAFGVE